MKFTNLKKSLTERVYPAYYLTGEDSFLLYKSLELLSLRFAVNFPEMNKVIFSEGAGAAQSIDDILNAAQTAPIMDDFKLIIVKDAKIKPVKADYDKFKEYVNAPPGSAVIVFFAKGKNEFFEMVRPLCEEVDCSKLDEATIIKFINAQAAASGITVHPAAAKTLINYCAADMSRINSELTKLLAYAGGRESTEVTLKDVEENVAQDVDYMSYELADNIMRKNKEKALLIAGSIMEANEISASAGMIINGLYSAFSRAFFAKISGGSDDAELARALGVKEYAVKKSREAAAAYSAVQLKDFIFAISHAEFSFKSGKVSADNAVNNLIYKLLI